MAAPQLLSRRANGSSHPHTADIKPAKSKASSQGEKVVVRRLPPGMTEEEFVDVLGNEWKLDQGRVDWFEFEPGKMASDPAKTSQAARAYLHLIDRDDVPALTDAVRAATWEDAKCSWNDPVLVGPPYVEVCMYKKVPTGKKRVDSRQGTIDSDPAFIAFLESLTRSEAKKEMEPDQMLDETPKHEKVTTTPLVEYIKEKRVARAKDAAAAKSAKHARQESLAKAKADDVKKKAKDKAKEKEKEKEKDKDNVHILTKSAAEAAKAVASQLQTQAQAQAQTQTQTAAASSEPTKSRRAGIAAAARILQRDLGLSPGNAHRKARQDAAKAEADAKADDKKPEDPTAAEPPSPSSSPAGRARAKKRGPGDEPKTVVLDQDAEAVPTPPVPPKKTGASSAATPTPTSTQPPPTPGATRAFVKHANPSQGVTEPLLKDAMQAFGAVAFVEVDRRKGFAYVDFADPDGLARAMAASPVAVAQAAVHVLERKETAAVAAARKTAAPRQLDADQGGPGPAAAADRERRGGRRRAGRGKEKDREVPGKGEGGTSAAGSRS